VSDLRLNLDTTDFQELVELGRSMIPTVAPGWTDHNVHDPGVMLMELVAWVADAEVYALSRTSRREREAYGHLLGLELTGPRPASGLVWPLAADAPAGTPLPWVAGTVINKGALVKGDRPQAPAFYATRTIELTTAALMRVVTRFADGSTRDWTRANSQQGATFLPFGSRPQKGDSLRLTLTGRLIGEGDRSPGSGATLSIGFEILQDLPAEADRRCNPVRLTVSLADAAGPWPVAVAEDTTGGLSHSGLLLLTVDPALAGQSGVFTLSIESEEGAFLVPPRVQRIALNVLPIEQVEPVTETEVFGTNSPDQSYQLRRSGLMYPVDAKSFTVALSNGSATLQPWELTRDLDNADPDAAMYAMDETGGILMFGNGINGRKPSLGATLSVEYCVTGGARGNLPRGIQWSVAGVQGTFGLNSEATSGGSEARDLAGLRAVARQNVRHARPIVTTSDLQDAALAFADLDIRRAQELLAPAGARRVAGGRVLVAVGPHDVEGDGDGFEESSLWLAEIRRRLLPRLPLGQGLDVIGPRLVDVRVIAHLVAAPQVNPDVLRAEVERTLRTKVTMTTGDGSAVWPFGRDLTAVTVKGWLRNVEGVGRVLNVALLAPPVADQRERIELGATALPRLQVDAGDFTIDRAPIGGRA